ncbi:hypothetical protein [Mesobacillus zeae]|nr:hypothetical protein [Mesobacillus zeae]
MASEKEYKPAQLSEEELGRIQSLESKLVDQAERDIIIIAYEKNE